MWYIFGLRLYDNNDALVLSTGKRWSSKECLTHTELLEEGERIIGYKLKVDPWNTEKALHSNLQLIIGSLILFN